MKQIVQLHKSELTTLYFKDAAPSDERDRGQGCVAGQRGEADPARGHAANGRAQEGAQEAESRGGQDLQGGAAQGQGGDQV